MMTDKQKTIALCGAGLLLVGVFTPIFSLPILGNQNFIQNGKGEGTIIIILAVLSLAFVFLNQLKGLYLTGVAALAVVTIALIGFERRISDAGDRIQIDLNDNPFKNLGNLGYKSAQLQWGWVLLFIGGLLLLAAAAGKPDFLFAGSRANCTHTGEDGEYCRRCGARMR